jgi:hypothetical protein
MPKINLDEVRRDPVKLTPEQAVRHGKDENFESQMAAGRKIARKRSNALRELEKCKP